MIRVRGESLGPFGLRLSISNFLALGLHFMGLSLHFLRFSLLEIQVVCSKCCKVGLKTQKVCFADCNTIYSSSGLPLEERV